MVGDHPIILDFSTHLIAGSSTEWNALNLKLFSWFSQESNLFTVYCNKTSSDCLLTFFLHPRDVLHVLDVVESVADGGLGHGGGRGQAVDGVEVLHQEVLRRLPRQPVGHITAGIKTHHYCCGTFMNLVAPLWGL